MGRKILFCVPISLHLQFLKSFPHVYEYHLQCVFTFVASIFFNFFLYYVMVPIIASHRRRLLQFLVVPLLPHLHEFFLSISRTEHILKHCSIAKCMNFPFQRVLIRPKLIPNKRVMSILSQRCNLSRRISERATSNVLAISPCTGLEIH